MGTKPKATFTNYQFHQFMDYALKRIAPEYLHLLSDADRRNIAKKEKFIRTGTLDEKLLLLSKIGFPFVLTVADSRKKYTQVYIERLLKVFFKKMTFHPRPSLAILKDRNFFFLADFDIVRSLMMATNLHNLSADMYINAASSMREAEAKVNRNISATHDVDAMITKAMRLATSVAHQDEFKAVYRIDYKKFLILSCLSRQREAPIMEMRNVIGLLHIKNELAEMVRDKMIESKFAIGKKNYSEQTLYWITGYGELLLNKARGYFLTT